MRLDDDSLFLEPFLTEERMELLIKYDYVYRMMYNEAPCLPEHTLWDFTLDFLQHERVKERDINDMKRMLDEHELWFKGTWANNVPYNNFHVSSLALWKNPLVRRYLDAIEQVGGILKYGWYDASVHAMIAFVLRWYTRTTVAHDSLWGYRHNYHVAKLYSKGLGPISDEFFPSSL